MGSHRSGPGCITSAAGACSRGVIRCSGRAADHGALPGDDHAAVPSLGARLLQRLPGRGVGRAGDTVPGTVFEHPAAGLPCPVVGQAGSDPVDLAEGRVQSQTWGRRPTELREPGAARLAGSCRKGRPAVHDHRPGPVEYAHVSVVSDLSGTLMAPGRCSSSNSARGPRPVVRPLTRRRTSSRVIPHSLSTFQSRGRSTVNSLMPDLRCQRRPGGDRGGGARCRRHGRGQGAVAAPLGSLRCLPGGRCRGQFRSRRGHGDQPARTCTAWT